VRNLSELVSIGIATKNRWQDLAITLEKIRLAGWTELPILIFDDNSDQPCPFSISDFGLKVTIKRFDESQGYIVRRNQLAQNIQTKYYLSLDDDSFPVAGSLEAAVEFIEAHENCFCLSFPVYNPTLNEHQSQSLESTPYPVRFFIGCGHLLRRDSFLDLGGYCEDLIHQGEEMDIAARAFQQQLYCYHFPRLQIHHTASNAGRNWHRMDFYGSRNIVLWNDWFVPNSWSLIKQTRTFISRCLLTMKLRRTGSLQGELAGIRDISKYKQKRYRMSWQEFKVWQSRPSC
jgi:GT2 family glycosyltransferase